ncbi:MAG: ABC transporter permease [Acidimicrobiales bacterium]|jgi:peptide/nickel transport system permease protein
MRAFALRRVGGAIVTLFATAVVSFLVFRLLPGDPAAVIAGQGATEAQIDAIRKGLGLNGNVVVQFVHWADHAVHGNLGKSVITNVPVSTLLAQRLPVTLELILTSMIVALVVAVPLSLGALWPRSALDRIGNVWPVVGLSVPVFWIGELLILLFSIKLQWLPASGYVSLFQFPLSALKSFLLPSISFGFYVSSFLVQFLKPALRDVMEEDYIRTARAKGLSEASVFWHHALRATMVPFVTQMGILLGTSVGATIVIEQVFNYPGFGNLFIQGIISSDFYVVQAGLLLIVGSVIVVNLVVDLIFGLLDPRVRRAQRT